MTGLPASLAAVGAILLVAGAAGYAAAAALVPRGPAFRPERAAWGAAVGALLLAGFVPLSLAVGLRPGWIPFLLFCALASAAGRTRRHPSRPRETRKEGRLPPLPPGEGGGEGGLPPLPPGEGGGEGGLPPLPPGEGRGEGGRLATILLLALLFLGVLLYAVRALTEPMWAADFLAIWGWKGKVIFGSASLPAWMWRLPELSFTHPEYPLGLPFLYAGVAFLRGRWDDHAMALLFPFLQGATLLLLAGWLRRRGAPRGVALAGAAALSLFEPLYRAFTTGMAEVPLSFFLLLLGTALADALDGETGSGRRLALAAAGAAALKNEGLFAAAVAAAIAVAAPRRPWRERWTVAAAALLPALAVSAAHRVGRGPLPLRDFHFDLILAREFPSRLLLGLRTILGETSLPAAAGLLAFGLMLVAGLRSSSGDRLLALATALLAAYAILPAFCVWGPDWLARTAFARTAAALAPLAAAGAALRLAPVFTSDGGSTGSAADPAA